MSKDYNKPDGYYCECCDKHFKARANFSSHKNTQIHKKNELKAQSRVKQYNNENNININNFFINININMLLPNGCNMSDCPLPLPR